MNIFSKLFADTSQMNNNKNENRRFQSNLSKSQVSNISVPFSHYLGDSVSFTAGIKTPKIVLPPKANASISGKLDFFSSIFELDLEKIKKVENFEQLLEFINKKNSSGDSIGTVLTESLNKIAKQISPDDKMVDFPKAVKLVFGLDGEVLSYKDIELKMDNKLHVQKVLQNKKFTNMIKGNIPAEKARKLVGVKDVLSVTKVDRPQYDIKVVESRKNFFSSIFKFDEKKLETIKSSDSLLKFINKENSSGYSIKSVLNEALNTFAEKNSSAKRLLSFADSVKLLINSKEMPSTETIRKEMNFTTTKYVQDIFKDQNFINNIIENIPTEKATNLVGVKGIQSITELNPPKITKQVIESRIKYLENFFVFDQEKINNINDYKGYLSLITAKNSSGHSIDSVLTESLNEINQLRPNSKETIKLALGIEGREISTYDGIKTKLKFNNVNYPAKILNNERITNTIKKRIFQILPENSKNLIGVNGLQPIIEKDVYKHVDKVIWGRVNFLARIFKFDISQTDLQKLIKTPEDLSKLMNIKNSSGQTINQVLSKVFKRIARKYPENNKALDVNKAVKIFLGMEGNGLSTYGTIQKEFGMKHPQRAFDLVNNYPAVRMIIENIPEEGRYFSIANDFDYTTIKLTQEIKTNKKHRKVRTISAKQRKITQVEKDKNSSNQNANDIKLLSPTKRKYVSRINKEKGLSGKNTSEVNLSTSIKQGNITQEEGNIVLSSENTNEVNLPNTKKRRNIAKTEKDKGLVNANDVSLSNTTKQRGISQIRKDKNLSSQNIINEVNLPKTLETKEASEKKPEKSLMKLTKTEKTPKPQVKASKRKHKPQLNKKPNSHMVSSEIKPIAKNVQKTKEVLPKSDTPMVTTKALVPYFPIIPKLNPNLKIDEINICLPEKYKINRYIQSDDRLRAHVINNIRPEVARVMKEIKAEHTLGIIKDKDIKTILNIIMQKFGINVEKQLYSDTEIYNMLVSSGVKISEDDFKVLVGRVYGLIRSRMGAEPPAKLYIPKHYLTRYVDAMNDCLPLEDRVPRNVSQHQLEIYIHHIRPRIVEAVEKFSGKDDHDFEIMRKIIELRFGINDNKLRLQKEIIGILAKEISDRHKFFALNQRVNELLIKKLDPNFQEQEIENILQGLSLKVVNKILKTLEGIFAEEYTGISTEKDLHRLLDEPYLPDKSRRMTIREKIKDLPARPKGIIEDYFGLNGIILYNKQICDKYYLKDTKDLNKIVSRFLFKEEKINEKDSLLTKYRIDFLSNLLPDFNVPKTEKHSELYNFLNTQKVSSDKLVKDILLEAFDKTIKQYSDDSVLLDQMKAIDLFLGLKDETRMLGFNNISALLTNKHKSIHSLINNKSGIQKIQANIPAEYNINSTIQSFDVTV